MKPILFNTDMVRAILDGRKTVTRRVVKPANVKKAAGEGYRQGYGLWIDLSAANGDREGHIKDYSVSPCWVTLGWYVNHYAPYRPGDILYVRETWRPHAAWSGSCIGCEIEYKAGGENLIINDSIIAVPETVTPWRPSIHMPREAARIFLRVTDVRVEQLQTEFFKQESAILELRAEGIDIGETCRECIFTYGRPCCIDEDPEYGSECGMLDDVRDDFACMWDSTIKPADRERYGWAANPWTWVVEFERCEKPEEG